MKISDYCADCLYRKQKEFSDDERYLADVKHLLDTRSEEATSPYMNYLFANLYEKYFGKPESRYGQVKKQYNDLALSMEKAVRGKMEASEDPLATAIAYSRIGNYIDFGALRDVNEETFLSLFNDVALSEADLKTYEIFLKKLEKAKKFLLLTDNCGEIVFDRLMIEEMKKRFPDIEVFVLVRGEETLNDATEEDALYVGMDKVAKVISNGNSAAGTVYELLSEEAKQIVDEADVIMSKGQGNYESFSRQGRTAFHSFLCKCELFVERFQVPLLTGVFLEDL